MKNSHIMECWHRHKKVKTLTITIGSTYRVEPINPQKKKHRDRVCTILELDDDFMPQNASVRFQDNNRVGKVCLSDLVPVDQVIEAK